MLNSIEQLLTLVAEQKASDLHLAVGQLPMVRNCGHIQVLEGETTGILTNEILKQMLEAIMTPAQFQTYQETLEIDFAYNLNNLARFRVNAFHQHRGHAAVFRVIPNRVISLAELQAPEIFKTIANQPRGLVLVTGPTGSGKSTTLAAMVDHINAERGDHILTIEDPIEFIHQNKNSIISQREVHRDTLSFTNALRSALREDPDVILVGELRDLETIRLAITAAETGHLVFGTLHTSSAAKTIDRIIDVFPGDEKSMIRAMLAESLRAVISQTLIPDLNKQKRVAAYEIMIVNSAIRNLIREAKVAQIYSAIQTGRGQGMQTLDQALLELVQRQAISTEDAKLRAENKDNFA